MLWRHLCLVRAWSAAGLLTCSMLRGPGRPLAEPEEPPPPAEAVTETVRVLDGEQGRRPGASTLRGPGPGPRPGRDPEHLGQAAQRRPPARPGRRQRGRPAAAAAAASRAWAWAGRRTGPAASASSAAPPATTGLPVGPGRRRAGRARRHGPRRPDGRADDPGRLPELRPADPDAARHVRAGGRGRLHDRRPRPQGAAEPGDLGTSHGRRPGGHVAGLQRRPVRADGRAGEQGRSTSTRSPWPPGSSRPSTPRRRPTWSTRPT